MVEELDSRLKRCPCCGGETVLGSLYGCRPWVTSVSYTHLTLPTTELV